MYSCTGCDHLSGLAGNIGILRYECSLSGDTLDHSSGRPMAAVCPKRPMKLNDVHSGPSIHDKSDPDHQDNPLSNSL